MNNNNWGSQPPRQAYNGLPRMPQQLGYQQQYGNGNAMTYMGNQQYHANGQYLPPPNHQIQQMPHYAQPQQQMQPTHNYHAQQHQNQQQIYSNGAYVHHTPGPPVPPTQYMGHQNYPQPNQPYSSHVAIASPRQMHQSVSSPRPHLMAQVQPQLQHQQRQPVSQPPQRRLPPPQQARPTLPSPQQQPRAPHSIKPNQLQQGQPQAPSPQSHHRPLQAINPNQLHQSHSQASSPQLQHHAPPSGSPHQLQRHAPIPSPQPQHNAHHSIDPNQLRQGQTVAPSPQPQHNAHHSIDPNQLRQGQTVAPSPQPQYNAHHSIDPNQLRQGQTNAPSPQPQHHTPTSIDPAQLRHNEPHVQSPQPQQRNPTSIDPTQLHSSHVHMPPSQPQRPVPDAIDPSSLRQLQPQPSAPPPSEPQQPTYDAIDPTKLHKTQTLGESAQSQRSVSDVIDPSQLMLKMEAPTRKSMPAAPSATRSPSVSHAHSPSQHFDTPAVLTCVADDCFRAAHSAIQDLATSLDQTTMDEYYKLIATGLGCLEAALALNKLPPRAEANVRLKYATILSEETDNLTEAEVALTKGISVCEKNRLTDLKYCMQFQLLKVLYRRNRKAALVALDKNISEATTYKAVDWVYAFRFLRVSFHLQSGNPADTHAMENLRNITSLATHRGDRAIAVLTSLLEGLVHLKSRKDDSIVRVQTCIAQAAGHQLDPSVHIPQIEVLTLLLDMACSLQQKSPQVAMQKLKALQFRMDELVQASDWDQMRDELLLPLKRQANSSSTVTDDTKTIIRPGGEYNFIVMSFVTKVHAFVLAYVLSGLALLYNGSKNEKLMEYWTEALNMLARKSELVRPSAHSLPMAIEQAKWRSEVDCYIHTLIALISATRTQWAKVHDCIQKIKALRPKPRAGRLEQLALYVEGAYYQGTGDLDKADKIFSDVRFDFAEPSNTSPGSTGTAPSEMALLAALNRIWIMQEPSRRNEHQTMELLEKTRAYCTDHADIDIRTTFHLVAAAIETNPPQSIQTVKRHISTGIKYAQAANNTQLLGVALNLMRSSLFDSVVGDQAVKSAKAGKAQAQRAGNRLWMSVGEGMLAETEEMQGQVDEAERLRAEGTAHANEAFVKPQNV